MMAILSVVELTSPPDRKYDDRFKFVRFLTAMYLDCLNAYFSPSSSTKHRTLSGYVTEPRAKVFEASQLGLRGLLAASVPEINERQWEFFRYAVLELVHCRVTDTAMSRTLTSADAAPEAVEYRSSLPVIVEHIVQLRQRYVEAAVEKALRAPEFQRKLDLMKATAAGGGQTEAVIKDMLETERATETKRVRELCRQHLVASLGKIESPKAVLKRLGVATESATEEEGVQKEPSPKDSGQDA
jgi:hypothetical protein